MVLHHSAQFWVLDGSASSVLGQAGFAVGDFLGKATVHALRSGGATRWLGSAFKQGHLVGFLMEWVDGCVLQSVRATSWALQSPLVGQS